MQVVIKKEVRHDRLGVLRVGRIVDIPEPWVSRWLAVGAVERYETKVLRDNPLPTAGAPVPLSASPADPASTEPTLKPSKRGGSRQAKPREG